MKLGRPTTLNDLTLVDGMNQQLIREYGEELLSVMNEGLRPRGQPAPTTASRAARISRGLSKSTHSKLNSSQSQTLDLLKQGSTIKEIANNRQLTSNTVENHIMKIVEQTDELDPAAYLSSERLTIITNYLKQHPEASGQLKPIKEELTKYNFSYFEIKIGLALYNKKTCI